jgi:hypothetical protein
LGGWNSKSETGNYFLVSFPDSTNPKRFHTAYSCVIPIVKPPASLLSVVRNLKANTIRVGKENCVIIGSILRVKLRGGTAHSLLRKALGNGVHGGDILDSKTEMMQTGTQRLLESAAVCRPQDKPKVAVVVLDMVVSLIRECVPAETKDTHDTVVKPLGTSEV